MKKVYIFIFIFCSYHFKLYSAQNCTVTIVEELEFESYKNLIKAIFSSSNSEYIWDDKQFYNLLDATNILQYPLYRQSMRTFINDDLIKYIKSLHQYDWMDELAKRDRLPELEFFVNYYLKNYESYKKKNINFEQAFASSWYYTFKKAWCCFCR